MIRNTAERHSLRSLLPLCFSRINVCKNVRFYDIQYITVAENWLKIKYEQEKCNIVDVNMVITLLISLTNTAGGTDS